MYRYTLCFIRSGSGVLMLNRRKPPNMGLWNGVGGKLEPGERPESGALREVAEETGLLLGGARFGGTLTWTEQGGPRQGIYIFLADLPPGQELAGPTSTPEGILQWLELDWVLHPENWGVVGNIKHFLPSMLRGEPPQNHHFAYTQRWSFTYETEAVDAGLPL